MQIVSNRFQRLWKIQRILMTVFIGCSTLQKFAVGSPLIPISHSLNIQYTSQRNQKYLFVIILVTPEAFARILFYRLVSVIFHACILIRYHINTLSPRSYPHSYSWFCVWQSHCFVLPVLYGVVLMTVVAKQNGSSTLPTGHLLF